MYVGICLFVHVCEYDCMNLYMSVGSPKANGRKPKVLLGRVFNFKIGHFASKQHKCIAHMQPLLELKTQPRFCPVN
jgi:hypothetical protein